MTDQKPDFKFEPYTSKLPSEPKVSQEDMLVQFQRNQDSLMKEFGEQINSGAFEIGQSDKRIELGSKLLNDAIDGATLKPRDMSVFGTSTGRVRYQSPELPRNPDNIPRNPKIEGSVVLDADFSEIEKRLTAEGHVQSMLHGESSPEASVFDSLHAAMIMAQMQGKPSKTVWSANRRDRAATGSGKRKTLRDKTRAQKKARRKQR